MSTRNSPRSPTTRALTFNRSDDRIEQRIPPVCPPEISVRPSWPDRPLDRVIWLAPKPLPAWPHRTCGPCGRHSSQRPWSRHPRHITCCHHDAPADRLDERQRRYPGYTQDADSRRRACRLKGLCGCRARDVRRPEHAQAGLQLPQSRRAPPRAMAAVRPGQAGPPAAWGPGPAAAGRAAFGATPAAPLGSPRWEMRDDAVPLPGGGC